MKKIFIYLVVAVFAVMISACSNATQNKQQTEEKPGLPADAILIKYQRHLYCDVMLRDSIPARMIFDTGCTNLLLDSTFYADKFGDSGNLRRAMLSGAGGGMELANIDASGWWYNVGSETNTEDVATVLNLRKIVGDGVDGMFGMIFMQGKRVELNYADNYMRFLPIDEKIDDDFIRIQCNWLDNTKMRILLPLSIALSDGYVFEGNYLVDTGMPGTLMLNNTTANTLKAQQHLSDARKEINAIGGIGGSSEEYLFNVSQITIGGYTIKDVQASWSGNKQGALADMGYDGLVGNELLDRFDVICDFVDCAIYLRPNNTSK